MKTMRRSGTAAAALVLVGLLAACGSGSSSSASGGGGSAATSGGSGGSGGGSSSSSAPDPCSLVTAAALSSAYGVTFGAGADSTESSAGARGFRACKWSDAGGTKSFILQTVASGGKLGETASALYDQSKDLYDGSTDGGVGDKSILLKEEGGFIAVKGNIFVQGNAIIFGASTPSGATKTVMQAVVGRL